MTKIISIFSGVSKGFFVNSFWKEKYTVVILILSLAISAFLWYIYATKLRSNIIPFAFASGILGLNIILSNFLFNKDKLVSFLLLITGLFVQILMIVFLRYLSVSF